MKVVADLHIHSKYSRAVSQQMVLPEIASWSKRKGIGLVGTGDWTHPLWLKEIKSQLGELGNGFLKLKNQGSPLFCLSGEISSIYSKNGKARRIHNLVLLPTIASAEKVNEALKKRGVNLFSDGRPICGIPSDTLAELILENEPKALIIPAHIWTPWFSLYGSESGFDTFSDCFGKMSGNIYAIETGLSSDPQMNWRIPELDDKAIISNSDAHSASKLGREATVFELEEVSFENMTKALKNQGLNHIASTIEFYPEEGKYHFTGHRLCSIKQSPQETKEKGDLCPVCNRKLTVGVMHRVENLAKNNVGKDKNNDNFGVSWYRKSEGIKRPPYSMIVPLLEIIGEAIGQSPTSQKVKNEYIKLTDLFQGEFKVLLKTDLKEIVKASGSRVAEAINRVRNGDIFVDPGYDGVFGVVKIWSDEAKKVETKSLSEMFNPQEETEDQLALL